MIIIIIDSQQEKKNLPKRGLYRFSRPLRKIKEREKRDKYLDLARELKTMEHEEGETNCN